MLHDVSLALVGLGVAVAIASAVGALVIGADSYTRLHFVTPITSVAGPLVAIGLCIQSGWGRSRAWVCLSRSCLLCCTRGTLRPPSGRKVAGLARGLRPVEHPASSPLGPRGRLCRLDDDGAGRARWLHRIAAALMLLAWEEVLRNSEPKAVASGASGT